MSTIHCLVCFPGFFHPSSFLPDDATDRERIAALCNHMMTVHRAGSVEAWEQALLSYPVAARAWEAEILAEAER
jgi:hypothetical protein